MNNHHAAIQKAKQLVIGKSLQVFQEVAVESGAVAIDATPVLSGHLVSNWALRANAPKSDEEDIFSPVRAATKQRMLAAVRGIKLGDRVFIANPTHYAVYINDGTPKIKPRMMTEIAVAAIPAIVKRAQAKANGR